MPHAPTTQHREERMQRYGQESQDSVEEAMHRRKQGTLKSGRSGKKVTSRKQAIAIGLSEAREKGAKVPPPRKGSGHGSDSDSSSSGSTRRARSGSSSRSRSRSGSSTRSRSGSSTRSRSTGTRRASSTRSRSTS